MAYPSDLARTKDWGTEVLTDADLEGQLDLIINWVMAAQNSSTGHKHDGTANESQKIDTGGIDDDAITFALIDDDGDFGLFTGDWSFNEIALVEDSAPTTAASEMKLYTKDTSGQPELFVREESDGDEVQITSAGTVITATGSAVQVVNTQTGAVATGATVLPNDDTIPQNTEGVEFMTLAITPTSATNKLKIESVFNYSPDGNSGATVALFQDSTANALAVGGALDGNQAASGLRQIVLVHYMTAGTTSETTFKIRAGLMQAGTLTFNGAAAGRKYGGVYASGITITEIKV